MYLDERDDRRPAAPANGVRGRADHVGAPLSRRAVLKRMSAAAGALAVGCTPLRIVLRAYPRDFEEDHLLVDRVLRAFVTTVIPGAPYEGRNLVRAFLDGEYPFAPYCSYFVFDLCKRAHDRYGISRFDWLEPEQRTQVVTDGLESDGTTQKLYRGAIFLAQLSFYAGIYDDAAGCPLIDFHGRFTPVPTNQLTHPYAADYLAMAETKNGNFG